MSEAYIPLRARDGSVKAYAIVDAEDFEWLNQYRWYLAKDGYVVRMMRIKGDHRRMKMVHMHRLILGLPDGSPLESDHINRNRRDNRRCNLRAVTKSQNAQNRTLKNPGSSRYRGVVWNKKERKWQVSFKVNGRSLFLGLYETEEQAAEVAGAWLRRNFPFARGCEVHR